MRRAAAIRLAPTSGQAKCLDAQGHVARWFWNALHEWFTACRENGRRGPSWAEVDRQLRGFLRDPGEEYAWVQVLGAQTLQHIQQDYEQTWQRCWAKRLTVKRRRPPKYKSRSRAKLSFDCPMRAQVRRLSRNVGEINLPKVGWVRFRWSHDLPKDALRGARLVKTELGWHAYVRLDLPDPKPQNIDGSVGIDRGVTHALTTSDGEFFDLPELLTNGERKRLLRLERSAARKWRAKKRGEPRSARLEKNYDQIRNLRARAKRRRRDWQHKTTTDLARRYGHISIEKFDVTSMTRRAHNSGVRQKAGLNRAILDVGWSTLESMLAYKLDERGSTLVHVPAPYTSQTCAECGTRDAASRVSQSSFRCTSCGHRANADVNAACNINAAGLAVSGREA